MITIALKLKSVNIILICFQEIKHTWALGIGQIYEHKTIHLELGDSYIQMRYIWASNLTLQSSYKNQNFNFLLKLSALACGQLDSAIFQLSWQVFLSCGELHDKQDKQFLIGQNHTILVWSWRVQRVWMTKSSDDNLTCFLRHFPNVIIQHIWLSALVKQTSGVMPQIRHNCTVSTHRNFQSVFCTNHNISQDLKTTLNVIHLGTAHFNPVLLYPQISIQLPQRWKTIHFRILWIEESISL